MSSIRAPKVFPDRIVRNDIEDVQSNASSTDDYVRELLDPDDRPKNVWHVVEGPKVQPTDPEVQESNEPASLVNDTNLAQGSETSNQSLTDLKPGHRIGQDEGDLDHKIRVEKRSPRSKEESRSRHERSGERASSSRRRRHRHDSRDYDADSDRERHRHRKRRQYSDDDEDDRHKSRRRSRSRSKTSSRCHHRSRSQSPITKRNSRTILIMQLSPRVTSRDLEDFFYDIGKVREVRLIMDSKTRRHKGIAYIEFEDAASASRAFSLNGRKFFGAPVVIQSAQLDRNRPSGDWPPSTSQTVNLASSHPSSRSHLPPNCYRVYVGGLHVNLTEDMIKSVFEPFGPIVRLELMKDRITNVSRGYAFITYANIEDGQHAVQALDGLELAGKALRVSKSTDKNERHTNAETSGAIRSGHHDSDSDSRSSRNKDVTANLYELAGH